MVPSSTAAELFGTIAEELDLTIAMLLELIAKEELDTVGKTMELLDSGIIAELLRKKSTDEDENGSIAAEDIACAALIESSTCW
jgi:hypothetical protein